MGREGTLLEGEAGLAGLVIQTAIRDVRNYVQATRDCRLKYVKDGRFKGLHPKVRSDIEHHAEDAVDFLFGNGETLAMWLEVLGLDPEAFEDMARYAIRRKKGPDDL